MKKSFLFLTGVFLCGMTAQADLVYDFSKPDKKNRHYTHAWASKVVERKLVDGILYGKTLGHPAYFTTDHVKLPLDRHDLLVIEMMAEPTSKEVQIHVNTGFPTAAYAVQKLKQDGKFHHYVFDLKQIPKVKNDKMLYNYRVNPVNSSTGKKFAIKSIRLMPRFQHIPGVEAVIPKAPAKLVVPEFFQLPNGGKAAAAVNIALSYTDEGLVMDYNAEINNVNYKADAGNDGAVFNDDCFDIQISVTPDCYYQIAFNPAGAVFDQKVIYADYLKGQKTNDQHGLSDRRWTSNAKVKSDIAPSKWFGTVTIPWSSMNLTGAPQTMNINIARCNKANGKGFSGWNYSPILSFADKGNLRKVTLGKTASARVTTSIPTSVLPGKNTISFANLDKRNLTCKVTVRDLATGQNKDFTATGKDGKIAVEYVLGESSYELLMTAFENSKMIFFDAKSVNTAYFRKDFAIAFNAVKRWKDSADYAAIKKELISEGNKLASGNDFAGMRSYIARVEKYNLQLQLEALYNATLKNFNRSSMPFAVASALSGDKIFHSLDADVPPFMGKAAGKLSISTAKNEFEGTQLVLVGMNKKVTGLSFKVVKAPAGKAPAVKLLGVDFVDTSKFVETKYKVSYRGEWPEVLANDLPKTLAPHEVRSIWVKAETAADVPAGTYEYTLEVSAKELDKPLQIPLTIKVWNFTLPTVPTLRTAMSNYDRFIMGYYERTMNIKLSKQQQRDINEMMVRFMLKNRMNPGHIYTMVAYSGRMIDYPAINKLGEYGKLGLNAVAVAQLPQGPFRSTPEEVRKKYYTPEKVEKMIESVKISYEAAKAVGMEHTFYIHAFDEIFAVSYREEKAKILSELAQKIRAVAPKAKIECITGVMPELIGAVDIWCPSINMMAQQTKSYKDRQKAGDELWLYTCLGAPGANNGLAPSFVLEESGAGMRLIGWICYFYKAEGFLYYSIGNWSRNGLRGDKPYPATPWNIQHVNAYNGEANLIYPAKHFTMEPLSSVRFENLRDGFEDYEYFMMLADAFKKNGSKLTAAEKAEINKLLDMKNIVRSGIDYTDDSAMILSHREKMAQWIERLNK